MKHEIIHEAHAQMRDLKEHWWHHHQEPDPPPALFIKWRDMEVASIDCAAMGGMIHRTWQRFPKLLAKTWGIPDTGPTGALLLYMTLAALQDGVPLPGGPGDGTLVRVEPGTPMEHIMFNVEGWAREIATPGAENLDEAIEQAGDVLPERGDMEKDFKENPLSDVRETMTTYIVQTDPLGNAEWMRATSMFHKDDGGVIVWHDAYYDDSENVRPDDLHDTLINVMQRFVTRESLA